MERCENDVCGLDKYKQVVQLHDKDKNSKEYPIFPVTYTHAVYDGKTGANLESMLAQFNNVFLQYQGTAKDTRLLLPKEMRRKGVQITYRNMDDEVVTEKCVNDSQSDNDHWGLDANWMRIDELSLQGDISVSKSGTWIINGADTGVKALGPKGDNGLTPWMKTIDNKLYYSYDNQTWELASDYIAAWFRFTGTSGSSQANNVGKIQISRDEGKTWADLSKTFTNNLHIKGYVATTSDLPSSAVQGDIYGVGPTYAESDTEHTNPIYKLFVKNENVWVDNGQFTSIAAGVVQELGESETEVISQKIVTEAIAGINNALMGVTCNYTSILQNNDIPLSIKASQIIKLYILDISESSISNYIIRSVLANGNVVETFYADLKLEKYQTIEINPTQDAPILRIIRQTAGDAYLTVAINIADSLLNLYEEIQTINANTVKLEETDKYNASKIEAVDEYNIDLLAVSQKNYYYNKSGIKTYAGGLYATTNKVRHDGMKRIIVKGNTHTDTNVPVIIPFDINGNIIEEKIVYGTSPAAVLSFSLEITEDIYTFVAQTRFALAEASINLICEETTEKIVNGEKEQYDVINKYVANIQRAILNRFTSCVEYQKTNEQQIAVPSEIENAVGIRIPSIQILSNGDKLLMALVNIGSVGDFSEFKEYVYVLNPDNSIKQGYEFVDGTPDLNDGIAYPTTCMVNGVTYLFYTKITQDSNANVTAAATYVRTTEDGVTWSSAALLNNEAGFLCGGGSKAFEEDGIIYVPFLMRLNNKKDSGFLAYNISEKSCYIKMLNADLGTDECSIYPDGLGNILISTRMTDGTLQGLCKVSKDEYNHGYEKMDIDTSDRLALQECCLYAGNGIVLRTRATDPSDEGGWQRGSQILEISYDFGITFKKICDISGIENKFSGGYTSISYYNNELCVVYETTPYSASSFTVVTIKSLLSQNISLI